MGRKRISEKNKRVAFNISVKKQVLEEFKRKVKENDEIASRVIENYMKQYIKEK